MSARFVFLVLGFTFTFVHRAEADLGSRVIYGKDNRREVCQEFDPRLQEVSRAIVAIIPDEGLITRSGGFRIKSENFGNAYELCSGERFADQPTAADCTGFLIEKDLVMTAAHCIETPRCPEAYFAFGYSNQIEGRNPVDLDPADVYRCKRVEAFRDHANEDFALIRLDRPVLYRQPLKLRTRGEPRVGDELVMMGHPSGLPMKISDGAKVRSVDRQTFLANLDSYAGNSGSPILNARTYEVEGWLVSGEDDFDPVRKGGLICHRSKKCRDGSCRGETVVRASAALPFL